MRPTLQQIAREAGVSKMTVSLALRARPQIPAVTRDRIRQIATDLGYQPDPTLNLLMAHVRSKAPAKYQATLALASFEATEPRLATQRLYVEGIEQQAARRGYSIDRLPLLDRELTPEKIFKILQTRGVKGLILRGLNSPFLPPAFRDIYEHFPCVVVGIKPRMPALHFVVGDAYASARMAFGEALKAGYRRPGVLFNVAYDQMHERRHMASFLTEQLVLPPADRVPLMPVHDPQNMRQQFIAWRDEHRPDCIISGFDGGADSVRDMGIRIPEDVGYVSLDREPDVPGIAGVDPNSLEIGAASVDLLIAMLHANECGVPMIQRSTLVEGTWVSGTSLPNLHDAPGDESPHPSWETAYALPSRPGVGSAVPLDLRGIVNRRLASFDGYNSPLLYLEAGPRRIHGVPFVLAEEAPFGAAAVAVDSRRQNIAGEPSATKAVLPMLYRASAIYFLHSCVRAHEHRSVARYELLYDDESRAAVEVVAAGAGLSDEQRTAASNVQDWWPNFPQFSHEHARHLVVASVDEPDLYSRYLYTFEWINPHPKRLIRALQITALPDSAATLIVLAVTVLEAEPAV